MVTFRQSGLTSVWHLKQRLGSSPPTWSFRSPSIPPTLSSAPSVLMYTVVGEQANSLPLAIPLADGPPALFLLCGCEALVEIVIRFALRTVPVSVRSACLYVVVYSCKAFCKAIVNITFFSETPSPSTYLSSLLRSLVKRMYSFRVMLRAPDSGGHASGVVAKPNYIYLISPGAFHWLDIKPHSPSGLMRTTNVNCGHAALETHVKNIRRLRILTALVTRMALNASAPSALTNLTGL